MIKDNGSAPQAHNLPNFELADPMFALSTAPGVEHLIYESNEADAVSELVRMDSRLPYPDDESGSGVFKEILLPSVAQWDTANRRHFRLPHNYVTMSHALNDAIGEDPTSRSMETAKGLFSEVGYFIARIANTDNILPRRLDYRQIIFPRDTMGIFLLPPLNFEQIEVDREAAQIRTTQQFWQSCLMTAREGAQIAVLEDAFTGFTESFKIVD